MAFGGSRTFHRIACAIEDAGFEIRDTIMWLYGSGFPKSMNIANAIEGKVLNGSANKKDFKLLDGEKGVTSIGFAKSNAEDGFRPNDYNGRETTIKPNITTDEAKKWIGWGTALKPAYEPVIVARKPFVGSCVDNVIKNGVGAINIDECRVGDSYKYKIKENGFGDNFMDDNWKPSGKEYEKEVDGRFPANVILTYDDTDEAEVCAGFPKSKSSGGSGSVNDFSAYSGSMMNTSNRKGKNRRKENDTQYAIDEGSASRYFYCAKASRRDRDEGLGEFQNQYMAFSNQAKAELKRGNTEFKGNPDNPLHYANSVSVRKNIHPTVKPTDLMQYLIRLVTPNGGVVLDPFNGSGSTGKAVMFENQDRNKGYKYIGIEMTEEYLPIAKARIEFGINFKEEPESVKGQMTIFDI